MRIKTYIKIYKDRDGWRWRMQAANGKIIADSGEAYTRARSCRRAAARMMAIVTTHIVVRDSTKRR